MKKAFLLIGCLALLASCGNKAKEEAPKAETEVAAEQPAVIEEAAPADPFPASESFPAKTDGFRVADSTITLYLVDAVNGANQFDVLADAMIVLADGREVSIKDADKTALNEKSASIWMKDGKVSRIKVNE